MLETKQEKQYFFTALILIIILSIVSIWSRSNTQNQPASNQQAGNELSNSQAYLKYLETLKVDSNASKALFLELFTQEDIRKEVELELKTDQPIKQPVISSSSISLSGKKGSAALTDYLANSTGIILQFNAQTKDASANLFSDDLTASTKVLSEYQKTFKELAAVGTPKEAVEMQKQLLAAFTTYGKFLQESKDYSQNTGQDIWPNVYFDYAAINDAMAAYNRELAKLSTQYNLSLTSIKPYYAAQQEGTQNKFALIKTANAAFGIGDVSITIGDIPRIIMDSVEQGLASSFAQFMGSFIQKFVAKIESNYMIANFLYYSDALVSGQYVSDYLNKYVDSSMDREVIKKLIPQFNCGKLDPNLKTVFQAKATEYLGFNPDSVSPSDPNYYQKMAKVGNFMASPQGWQSYYEDLANLAKSEAEKAVEKELTSNGLKTPRDTVNRSISNSINSIVSSEKAAISSMLQIGASNAKTLISSFVAQLTQSLMNNFVFRGATNVNGSIGVYKEQSTCLAAAQMQVVLPTATVQYQAPAAAPTKQQVITQECEEYPEMCTQQIRGSQSTSTNP